MNFPGVDLLDQAIFDTLVDDSTLLGLHLQLELHGFGGQEGNDSKALGRKCLVFFLDSHCERFSILPDARIQRYGAVPYVL